MKMNRKQRRGAIRFLGQVLPATHGLADGVTMDRLSLDEFGQKICELARRSFFTIHDELPMLFYLVDGSGRSFVFQATPEGGDHKDAIAATIRREIQQRQIVRYAIACEAWASPNPKTPFPECYSREEIVVVSVEDRGGKNLCSIAKITRCGEKRHLSEFGNWDTPSGVARFTKMFENESIKNNKKPMEVWVAFCGYSAYVVARRYGREMKYGELDFVSGAVHMHADDGWVLVPKRADLEPFLKTLSEDADQLQDLVRKHTEQTTGAVERTALAGERIEISKGPHIVSIAPGTKVSKFIRQITQRFDEVRKALEQAEEIGSRIKRRPYSEYIDEIEKTGISRIEHHGFALLVGGKLNFSPEYRLGFARMVGNTCEVHSMDKSGTVVLSPDQQRLCDLHAYFAKRAR
jgi:hypothetical protein